MHTFHSKFKFHCDGRILSLPNSTSSYQSQHLDSLRSQETGSSQNQPPEGKGSMALLLSWTSPIALQMVQAPYHNTIGPYHWKFAVFDIIKPHLLIKVSMALFLLLVLHLIQISNMRQNTVNKSSVNHLNRFLLTTHNCYMCMYT